MIKVLSWYIRWDKIFTFSFSFRGKKPKKVYVNEGKPLAISAVNPALGPGMVSTAMLCLCASTTSSYPG